MKSEICWVGAIEMELCGVTSQTLIDYIPWNMHLVLLCFVLLFVYFFTQEGNTEYLYTEHMFCKPTNHSTWKPCWNTDTCTLSSDIWPYHVTQAPYHVIQAPYHLIHTPYRDTGTLSSDKAIIWYQHLIIWQGYHLIPAPYHLINMMW